MSSITTNPVASRWAAGLPKLIYLAVGLLLGPVIANLAGWQLTAAQVQNQTDAKIIEEQIRACVTKARLEAPAASMLSFAERDELARKWASSSGAIGNKVYKGCARQLAGP